MSTMKFLILFVVFFSTACASKGTTVVLIDDVAGKVGQVEVRTEKGAQLLDNKGESTVVSKAGTAPAAPTILADAEIQKKFKPVLAAQPMPPKHFLLYFESGKVTLLAQSVGLLDEIVTEARKSTLCDLAVVGHSDTKGAKENNISLSLERANAIRDLLVQKGIPQDCMAISSHGEGNPIVPTADDVDEPQNRRVEVVVR